MIYDSALLLYPYVEGKGEPERCFPPIGIEYIATILFNMGMAVNLIDLRHEKEFVSFLKDKRQLIGISVNWFYEIPAIPLIVEKIPENFDIIIGGRAATNYVEEILNNNPRINCIVRGEGEETIKEIVSGTNFEDINNISYRKDGKILHNNNSPIKPIDNNLILNRSLRRTNYEIKDFGFPIDFISTSRGCPFNCKFCNFSLNPLGQKRKWEARSPESVINELKQIESENIFITDDNFAVDTKRVEEICDLIIENKLKKRFIVAVRIDISRNEKMLLKMQKAGFKMLLLGIESASDRILKMMEKGFTLDEAGSALKTISKYKFILHGFFMVGNLTETKEEMLKISYYARKLRLDTIETHILRTDKYSPVNDLLKEYPQYKVSEGDHYMRIYSDKLSLEDLQNIQKEISKNFFTFFHAIKLVLKLFSLKVIKFSNIVFYIKNRK